MSRDQEIGRGKVLLMVSGLGPLGDLPSPGPAFRVVFGTATFCAVLFTVVSVICTVVSEPLEKILDVGHDISLNRQDSNVVPQWVFKMSKFSLPLPHHCMLGIFMIPLLKSETYEYILKLSRNCWRRF